MNQIFREYILPRLVIDIGIFFVILMCIGIMAARLPITWSTVIVIVINYLMTCWAFIYNDMEDREDDSKSSYQQLSLLAHLQLVLGIHDSGSLQGKRFRNPFSFDIWSIQFGYLLFVIIAVICVVGSYLVGGIFPTLVAISNLVVGFLYSWRKVRLKSLPGIDLLSHAYLLAAVQILYFLTLPGAKLDPWAFMLAGVIFSYSLGSDLENEYRDFDDDRVAGLRNTASMIGKRQTLFVSALLRIVAVVLAIVGCVGAISTLR